VFGFTFDLRRPHPIPKHETAIEPPKPRIEAVRIVDMSTFNAWAEFAGTFTRTHPAFLEHQRAKVELKGLVPEGRAASNRPWRARQAL
jgi:hypothetical protein